jgi:hypothetical protein
MDPANFSLTIPSVLLLLPVDGWRGRCCFCACHARHGSRGGRCGRRGRRSPSPNPPPRQTSPAASNNCSSLAAQRLPTPTPQEEQPCIRRPANIGEDVRIIPAVDLPATATMVMVDVAGSGFQVGSRRHHHHRRQLLLRPCWTLNGGAPELHAWDHGGPQGRTAVLQGHRRTSVRILDDQRGGTHSAAPLRPRRGCRPPPRHPSSHVEPRREGGSSSER